MGFWIYLPSVIRLKLTLYFTLGYPDRDVFDLFLKEALKTKVEYVEVGIPTKHPDYDGPLIRKTHRAAMKHYSTDFLASAVQSIVAERKKAYALVYYNHFHGDEQAFIKTMKEAGFSGMIVPDLLTEYFDERITLARKMESSGLHLIPFVNSSTPDAIIEEISGVTGDWIYHGLQPSTGIRVPVDLEKMTERIESLCPGREIIYGFGINSKQTIRELRNLGAGGIAVGSSFIPALERCDLGEFRNELQLLEEGVYEQ